MPTEGANFIRELDPASPTGTDPVSEGDDELQQLKDVFVAQFSGMRGEASNVPLTRTAAELNDAPEASLDTQVISGDWEFTGELRFNGGQFGFIMGNGSQIQGFKTDGTTNINLATVGDNGPTLDKAVFGGTNADSVYEGDVHEFNGDVTLVASTTGTNAPGNLTIPGGLTSADRLEFENGVATTTQSNLNATPIDVGIPCYLPNGTFVGWIQMHSGPAPP